MFKENIVTIFLWKKKKYQCRQHLIANRSVDYSDPFFHSIGWSDTKIESVLMKQAPDLSSVKLSSSGFHGWKRNNMPYHKMYEQQKGQSQVTRPSDHLPRDPPGHWLLLSEQLWLVSWQMVRDRLAPRGSSRYLAGHCTHDLRGHRPTTPAGSAPVCLRVWERSWMRDIKKTCSINLTWSYILIANTSQMSVSYQSWWPSIDLSPVMDELILPSATI